MIGITEGETMDKIAEVREADARPETAEIYRQIKTASGIPQVNLIWRHFATKPDVLVWAWTTLAPLMRSDGLRSEAAALRRGIRLASNRPPVWAALDSDVATDVRNVLAFYNRGNSQNMLALTTLLYFARHGKTEQPFRLATATMQQPRIMDVPPLPKLADLNEDTRSKVEALAERHQNVTIGVIPSMYLHLAIWPAALSQADALLDTVVASAVYNDAVSTLIATANERSAQLTAIVNAQAARPPPTELDTMLETLDRFVTATIPEMIVVGQILAGAATQSSVSLGRQTTGVNETTDQPDDEPD